MRKLLFIASLIAAIRIVHGAELVGNKITEDGTYTISTIPGQAYVFSASGDFGSGSLAIKWNDGTTATAFAKSPATSAETWTLTAPTRQVDLVLTGATDPAIIISLAPVDSGSIINAAVAAAIAEDPEAVWSSLLASGAAVVVDAGGTDTERGTALLAAYMAAKSLTPNASALSATNRATVIIPPGAYKVTESLNLDTNYVDLLALYPERGGNRLATDGDYLSPGYTSTPLDQFRPPNTYIYSDAGAGSEFDVVVQSCADVRLTGFGIAQLASLSDPFSDDFDSSSFYCSLSDSTANAPSKYQQMYFWNRNAGPNLLYDGNRFPVEFAKHVRGTWIDCIANSYAWRCGGTDPEFSAIMQDCEFGQLSIAGDAPGASFVGSIMVRCKSIGLYESSTVSGGRSFGGCESFGADADATSLFVECEGGDRCFSQGMTTQATYIRCRAEARSFGATAAGGYAGNFAGYAEDCIGGADSFGGTIIPGVGKCTGKLIRCIGEGNTKSTRIEGATIRNSRITTATTGIHALTLLDSNNVISNSDVIVLQGGTGVPIYAGSALNVAAYHCRMNNASNDADGLGANVTNLVSSAGNVVSDSVK